VLHSGVDIEMPVGTPVKATAEGIVSFSGWGYKMGYVVVLEHGHGFSTVYAHNSKNMVAVAQRVKRGQVIAASGSTGRTTGAHVHYEVWKERNPINPLPYMSGGHDIFKKKKPVTPINVFLGADSSIKGDVATKGAARIDGWIEGNVEVDWLILGDTGAIKGDIVTRGVIVAGKIEGNVKAEEMVEIKPKGEVMGDIHTLRLIISEGATFDGRSHMKHCRDHEQE